ncbi:RNA polymerase sigma factor [Alteromonas sp. ASW11-130]|uniref:RNA polymerase sigma factor n=1 Tax=Alteromonas sp. ASW11-130 TaxID=3015775 RepID=UPI002241ABE6|nr:RNA polymerase sigma factor [Alteromonas sp. ASW11-130]MCW8093105.1 RNA polymerase sigma factor [Alteromonas sp. ASW11-130]
MTKQSTLSATYIKYRSKLMGAISSIVSMDDIEDIVQEAFIKSYEAELKQEIRYARTYMLRTVKNLALNHVSSAANTRHQAMDDMDTLPHELVGHTLEKHVESKERFINFCRATDTLSPEVKRVFLLKKVYGMKQKEIAELVGLSESTVEKHVAKGLLHCSQYLATLNDEGDEQISSISANHDTK